MSTIQEAFDLFKKNQFFQSLQLCHDLIERDARAVDAYYLSGLCSQRLQKYLDANLSYEKALSLNPEHWNCLYDFGNCLREQGDLQRAESVYQEVLNHKPDHYLAWYALGLNYLALSKNEEAKVAFERSLSFQGNFLMAAVALATALKALEKFDACESLLKKILSATPDHFDARGNLANLYFETGRYEEAYKILAELLDTRSEDAQLNYNIANVLQGLENWEAAIKFYRKSIELAPNFIQAHYNYACLLLKLESYEEGFKEYAWRKQIPHFYRNTTALSAPLWKGENLSGKRLLVRNEQGVGDFLMFSRLLGLIPQGVAQIDFLLAKRFHALLKGRWSHINLIELQDPSVIYDFEVHLIDLAGILSIGKDDLPAPLSFSEAPIENPERLAFLTERKDWIAIFWKGTSTRLATTHRSIDLVDFRPLIERFGDRVISLQQDPSEEEKSLPIRYIPDFDQGADAFADTLQVLKHCERVISIDTSMAHLAASQRVHVDLLVPFLNEWRWQTNKEDSPWYPSMHIWRRGREESWQDLIKRLLGSLK